MRVALNAAMIALPGVLLQGCSSKSPSPSPSPGPSPTPTPPGPAPAPPVSYKCDAAGPDCVQCDVACESSEAIIRRLRVGDGAVGDGCKCQICKQGLQADETGSCTKASGTAPMVFYAYYAKDSESYPFENQDGASALGVIEYLHREVVGTTSCEAKQGQAAQLCERHFCIDRIHRQRITMMNPSTVYTERTGQFGPWNSFNAAACTPASDCTKRFEKYGYNVGCMKNPYDPPFNTKPLSGGNYYDFPGECPLSDYTKKTDDCKKAQPGGQCSQPDGTSNCTWHAEDAGYVMIDDLSGITSIPRPSGSGNFTSFHEWCTTMAGDVNDPDPTHHPWKGDYPGGEWAKDTTPKQKGQKSLPFWLNPGQDQADQARASALEDLFAAKYPDSPRLPEPVCDW
mmetsp:Transcript_2707/g.5771  ORF Transcript_2707/g.5771 Transcript_2707/m.5771 type:complete len:398 (-) Transcript_2707:197-1390(-)